MPLHTDIITGAMTYEPYTSDLFEKFHYQPVEVMRRNKYSYWLTDHTHLKTPQIYTWNHVSPKINEYAYGKPDVKEEKARVADYEDVYWKSSVWEVKAEKRQRRWQGVKGEVFAEAKVVKDLWAEMKLDLPLLPDWIHAPEIPNELLHPQPDPEDDLVDRPPPPPVEDPDQRPEAVKHYWRRRITRYLLSYECADD